MTVFATDMSADFVTIWHCEPPVWGSGYRCIRDEWIDDGELGVERHIYEWEPKQ